MAKKVEIFVAVFLNLLPFITCPYPPTGDEVLPGSVLLPASRRGRYLANIVRRQAVDGTGIKFNKDADRLNAEAKKKVDVLSDELLPYIIAEQERRTTLYKRIMTAIQNGEKGVTIAEIRNKPPLIIRKGLMYRCPSNRAPKEPDGSGSLMCEDEIEPTQVMYDSCLSAEDKELFVVADSKYFFCNRHNVEGPDLPRNGSTVIGCPPMERTSLNYTTTKCALEDTDDVVVHYRYYPDRSYKFVMELDPDHEVCDHWNPCQIGYIYSLPSPDQAILANELWRGYKYERDEIVPPIPEDAMEEFVHPNSANYTSSPRRINIPPGYTFEKLYAKRTIDNYGWNPQQNRWRASATVKFDDNNKFLTARLNFPETWSDFFYSTYYAIFSKPKGNKSVSKSVKFLTITMSSAQVVPNLIQLTHGIKLNSTQILYKCPRCHIQGIMVRTPDGYVHNIDPAKYRIKEVERKQYLEIDLADTKPSEVGDFFAIIQNADGIEERVKVLSLQVITVERENAAVATGSRYERTTNFDCEDCELTDVLCNGESAKTAGRVAIIPASKMMTFNFQGFTDSEACVYLAIFKVKSSCRVYRKIVTVIENDYVTVTNKKVLPPPATGEQFERVCKYTCSEECTIERVTINGVALESNPNTYRRSGAGGGISNNAKRSVAFYVEGQNTVTVRITEYVDVWEGVYQTVFNIGGESITKTCFEIGPLDEVGVDKNTPTTPAEEVTAEATAAPEGEQPPTPEGEQPPTPEGEQPPTPEGEQPPTPEGEQPPTPEGEQPPTPEGEQPPTPEREQPPTPEGEQPPTSEGEQPSTAETEPTPEEEQSSTSVTEPTPEKDQSTST